MNAQFDRMAAERRKAENLHFQRHPWLGTEKDRQMFRDGFEAAYWLLFDELPEKGRRRRGGEVWGPGIGGPIKGVDYGQDAP